jgi:hypothetical protein
MNIDDLSLVSLVKSRMFQDCPSRSCQNTSTNAITTCTFDDFISDVSHGVGDVMVLSLLNPITLALLRFRYILYFYPLRAVNLLGQRKSS